MFSLWLVKTLRTDQLYKAVLYSYVDNSGVDVWINKQNAKHAFQSKLLCLRSHIEMTYKCKVIPVQIPSKEMVLARADTLSRYEYKSMLGIRVIKVNRQMFRRFSTDVDLAYTRMCDQNKFCFQQSRISTVLDSSIFFPLIYLPN